MLKVKITEKKHQGYEPRIIPTDSYISRNRLVEVIKRGERVRIELGESEKAFRSVLEFIIKHVGAPYEESDNHAAFYCRGWFD